MNLELSPEYYEMAAEWQRSLVRLLKEELRKRKIDAETSRDICGDFIFNVSMLHDQGEIRYNGAELNPKISFDNFEGSLLSTSEDTYLHEFAYRSAGEVFDE